MALAGQLGRASDQAQAGAWLCTLLLHLGRYAELLAQAKTVLPLLAAPAVADTLAADRRELLRVVTLAACETGAFDTALDAAHELVRLTADVGESGPNLSAAFALAVCFERMGDSWQAIRLLQQTLRTVDASVPAALRLRAFNGLCAISIGVYHRLVGAVSEGEARAALDAGYAAGLQARALMPQVFDPVSEVAILGNLGEVLLYRGEHAESDALLRTSLDLARMRGLTAHSWRIEASIGGWRVAAGQPAAALAAMHQLLQTMGDDAPQQTAVRANHVAYLACRALSQPAEALAFFEVVESGWSAAAPSPSCGPSRRSLSPAQRRSTPSGRPSRPASMPASSRPVPLNLPPVPNATRLPAWATGVTWTAVVPSCCPQLSVGACRWRWHRSM